MSSRAARVELLPDTSSVVLELPDGWSVRELVSFADMDREGVLMESSLATRQLPAADWHWAWRMHPDFYWRSREPNSEQQAFGERAPDGEGVILQIGAQSHEMASTCPLGLEPWGFKESDWDYSQARPLRLEVAIDPRASSGIYSLRDPENQPHLTAQSLTSASGPAESDPDPADMRRLAIFFEGFRQALSPEEVGGSSALGVEPLVTRRCQQTKSYVSLIDNRSGLVAQERPGWLVYCEAHSTSHTYDSRRHAIACMADPVIWCDGCRQHLRP